MHVHRITDSQYHFNWLSNKISLKDILFSFGGICYDIHIFVLVILNLFKSIHGTNFGKFYIVKKGKRLLWATQLPGCLSWSPSTVESWSLTTSAGLVVANVICSNTSVCLCDLGCMWRTSTSLSLFLANVTPRGGMAQL